MTEPVIEVERLEEMANQIADFFSPYPEERAVEGIRNHLRNYWDPRMREALIAHDDEGGAGLDARVRAAVARLRDDVDVRAYAGPPREGK